MKSIFTFILVLFLIQVNTAQSSFKKTIGNNNTSSYLYNLITHESDIIISGSISHYNITDTIDSGYLCKLSSTGEILQEKETILQDTAIIHRDIVKGDNNTFWAYTFLFNWNESDNIYSYKLTEYDYDFNILKEFNVKLPDSLILHWWPVRYNTRLRYNNNELILSDLLTSKKTDSEGYYDTYTFYYNLNTNGDSINFKMEKQFGSRTDFKFHTDNNIYSTRYNNDWYGGQEISKTHIHDFINYDTFHIDDYFFVSNEETYLEFISDTSFVFSGTSAEQADYAYISVLDTSFNLIKSKIYGTGKFQLFSARNNGLTVANDGSIYTVFSRGIASEYMITKLDADLNVIWERFFISGGDFLYSIKATNDNACVILGNTIINNKYHALVLKLDAEGNLPASIENPKIKTHELILYPNPSKSNLNIRTAVQRIGGEFKMYDISGKQILQQKITESITQINTNNLPAGAYIYKYIHKNKVIESGKWIKE